MENVDKLTEAPPVLLRLVSGDSEPLRLLIDTDEGAQQQPLGEAIRCELRHSPQPVSRTALRRLLRVNNARLGEALLTLEKRSLVVRSSDGWGLPPEHDSSQTDLFS